MDKKCPRRNRLRDIGVSFCEREFFKRLDSVLPGSPGSGLVTDDATFAFRCNLLRSEILSKFSAPDALSAESRRMAALEKWLQCEETCKETNRRLKEPTFWRDPDVCNAFRIAREKISRILYRHVPYGTDLFTLAEPMMSFGPGATVRLSRKHRGAANKYSGSPETSHGNLAYALRAIEARPLWLKGLQTSEGISVTICNYSKIVTVPKSNLIDRPIGIEPDLNIFVQKGFGSLIRRSLKSEGIDLDCQLTNQKLAIEGSKTGRLATIDLSSASDTVSYGIVARLLPPEWLDALEQCRTPFALLNYSGSTRLVELEKFSAMGNGYTFELESLIFYALAFACSTIVRPEGNFTCSVYGDDIIVESEVSNLLLKILSHAGFKPNEDKSHTDVTDPYRESCGTHAYSGSEVRPFYIRRPVSDLKELFLLHNNLRRWMDSAYADILHFSPVLLEDLEEILYWIRSHAPYGWRKPRIPVWKFGDGAFCGSAAECDPRPYKPYWHVACVQVLDEEIVSTGGFNDGSIISSLLSLESLYEGPSASISWGTFLRPDTKEMETTWYQRKALKRTFVPLYEY